MSDLIDRQAAIDKFTSMPTIDGLGLQPLITVYDVVDTLGKIPSAQPEIIHCKDCKYWQDQEEGVVEVPICARPANKYEKFPFVMIIGGDGFCSYTERRTDETN